MTSEGNGSTLAEVTDGVHAWVQPDGTWWVNNAGFVHHDDAILLVDTCATKNRTSALLAAASKATRDAPIKWAVNTHQHGDHTYGNGLLPGSTVLIGHENMRAGLRDDPIFDACPPIWTPVPDWGVERRRLPELVFESTLTVHLGDLRVDLHHPGHPAHTSGDVIVHVPGKQVLFAGDLLFNGLTPMLLMGSVDGARRALEWIASFEPRHIVPGHGPVIGSSELDRVLAEHDRYYRLVAATAAEGLTRGLSPLDAARNCDLGEFTGWADAERLVLNVHKAYADHRGAEVDLVAAFSDAMTWHGGQLPTTV
ncbi:MBL fold metallo-hydrolase [Amycolatopsis pigmentata]|uniref:MBL fold metallo-hydrolase n=1 Tax=Amycolatopsis pigmentata TaxID=450801 RepID=A0ABW5FYF5_9PSEU